MPMNKRIPIGAINERGFTLLEILVAIVVISLGLLGLAGLQALSLRNNQVAYYRSIASQQAYDMADRLRANLAGVRVGNYDNLTGTLPGNPGCFTTGCSTANMVTTDQFQWLTNNAALLPGGTGLVRCMEGPPAAATCATNTTDPNSPRVFDITVQWTERTELGSITQSFVTRFVP